jgi:hypothetical protein
MTTRIEILDHHYDKILNELPKESRLYSQFKNGFIVSRSSSQGEAKVIQIFCHEDESEEILKAMKQHAPEVAPKVTTGLNLNS